MARTSDKNNPAEDQALPLKTSLFRLETSLALLVVLTLIAILAERPILETSMSLTSKDGMVGHYSDGGEGGNTVSEITDPDAMAWRCRLMPGAAFTFCGFELIFDVERQNGLDLRHYDQIRLWLDYDGPTETVRIYLRNFDPEYSTVELNDSTKYNQVELSREAIQENQPLDLAMGDFFVANWWFQRYRLPPSLGHPQFDNIIVFEVQTGSAPIHGEHQFRLERIELTGQVLTTEQWYQGIIGVWLSLALLFLGSRTVLLTKALGQKSKRERELMEVNALLDSRSHELEEKAKTDPLTGAFNRDGIEEAIREGLAERRSHGKPLSIIMLDVDYFKQVNDTHGHPVGDRILAGLSQLVKANIRGADLFARWGGEEFVLVCQDTQLKDAAALAEKLRALIEREDFGEPVSISASFGVATLAEQESLDQIFVRVDRALYAAKAKGRNRVAISQS